MEPSIWLQPRQARTFVLVLGLLWVLCLQALTTNSKTETEKRKTSIHSVSLHNERRHVIYDSLYCKGGDMFRHIRGIKNIKVNTLHWEEDYWGWRSAALTRIGSSSSDWRGYDETKHLRTAVNRRTFSSEIYFILCFSTSCTTHKESDTLTILHVVVATRQMWETEFNLEITLHDF